jgi:hypothetical protein
MPFINKIRLAIRSFINMFFTIFAPFSLRRFFLLPIQKSSGFHLSGMQKRVMPRRRIGYTNRARHDASTHKSFFPYITTSLTVAAAFSVVAVT